jgi:type IV fimbrial biogenesis protein FimT
MLSLQARRQRGATLLELMITVTIVGIVGAIGIPQMGHWIRNSSVTSAAEILQNGLRQAEAEAIRRNLRVEFLLTNGTPSASTIKSLTATANGKNWAIRALDGLAPLADQNAAYVSGFLLKDVSPDITVEGPASVLFSGAGRVLDNKGAAVASHQVYRISRSTADKALCVFVTPGGGVKLCNPALASGEPFACQPQISASVCPKA